MWDPIELRISTTFEINSPIQNAMPPRLRILATVPFDIILPPVSLPQSSTPTPHTSDVTRQRWRHGIASEKWGHISDLAPCPTGEHCGNLSLYLRSVWEHQARCLVESDESYRELFKGWMHSSKQKKNKPRKRSKVHVRQMVNQGTAGAEIWLDAFFHGKAQRYLRPRRFKLLRYRLITFVVRPRSGCLQLVRL